MRAFRALWSESWRVLAYTLAIALAFIALGRLQTLLLDALGSSSLYGQAGMLETAPDADLLEQAAQVAARSQAAVQRLPPGHRLNTLRMGYEIGYASQLTGGVAMVDEAMGQNERLLAGQHMEFANQAARLLGVQPEAALTTDNLQQFAELTERIENDESGAAARIESQLSVLHRHLFLLGAHLGKEHARIEVNVGKLSSPPARLIRRHATLAGIDIALWQPLIITPSDETPEQVLERYRSALARLSTAEQQKP